MDARKNKNDIEKTKKNYCAGTSLKNGSKTYLFLILFGLVLAAIVQFDYTDGMSAIIAISAILPIVLCHAIIQAIAQIAINSRVLTEQQEEIIEQQNKILFYTIQQRDVLVELKKLNKNQ